MTRVRFQLMKRYWAWFATGCAVSSSVACLVKFEERPVVPRDSRPDATPASGGGTGGSGNTSTVSSEGSSGPASGGSSTLDGRGGSTTNSGGTGGETSDGSGGVSDSCSGVNSSCSACSTLICGDTSGCCTNASYFGALSFPEWLDAPDLVSGFLESPTEVSVDAEFTGVNQVVGIVYELSERHTASSISVDADLTGDWDLSISLEDGASGCAFYVVNGLANTAPFSCWGEFADSQLMGDVTFTLLRIALETSGRNDGGSGSLTVHRLAWSDN